MKKTVSWLLSIMLGTLLIFTTTPSTTVHASNDTLQPFYNNPLNPNPDAIYTGGGVEYFFRYAAIDNITETERIPLQTGIQIPLSTGIQLFLTIPIFTTKTTHMI